MFFGRRSTQAEYLDTPGRSPAEIAADYRELGRVNRLFKFSHPFQWVLTRRLGPRGCRDLKLLDAGAGDGMLGRDLADWAGKRGWVWHVTNLDLHPAALNQGAHHLKVAGSVLELPFADGSFDGVLCSQMTHHLGTDAEVAQHFREAWRVTRDILIICDLHRNAALYGLVWAGTLLCRCSPLLRADGLISVRRGFRLPEWRVLAARAGIPGARISLYFGTRILLQARKAPP
jgi:2-polyprenyl-3-methyl-5-hydroxy-6-metoxy-1,4-benzoquinol methylase